jgi:hypothetical protein
MQGVEAWFRQLKVVTLICCPVVPLTSSCLSVRQDIGLCCFEPRVTMAGVNDELGKDAISNK